MSGIFRWTLHFDFFVGILRGLLPGSVAGGSTSSSLRLLRLLGTLPGVRLRSLAEVEPRILAFGQVALGFLLSIVLQAPRISRIHRPLGPVPVRFHASLRIQRRVYLIRAS